MKKQLIMCSVVASLLIVQGCKKNETLTNNQTSSTPGKRIHGPVSDYAEYTISCVAGGKFIEVTGNPAANEKYKNQAKIVQYAASLSGGVVDGWQRWYVIYKTTVSGIKYYHIRNSFSGKFLDVPSASTTSGTQLQQYLEFPLLANQQLWKIVEIGTTGKYNIINKGNGLAVTNAGASTGNGTAITQETLGTADKQKWTFTVGTANTYRDDNAVRFFERNNPAQGSVAFDQGNSIPLTWSSNNGKVLWVTQDASDGSQLQSNGLFNCNNFAPTGNTMFIQPNINDWGSGAPNVTRNGIRRIVDIQSGNTFAWPGPGIEIGQHVYVNVGEGNGLTLTNQSLWDLTQSTGTAWTGVRTLPAGMSGQTAIGYSAGMVKASDGYVYVFGSQTTGFGYTKNIHVARFPQSNPQSWTFWNGSSWTSTPTAGTTARIAEGLGSTTVSFCNNKWVLMTMDQGFNCDATRNIYIATASSLTGPFSALTQVYTIKENINGNYARYYTPAIHPEHVNGRNELLLTYCLNYGACGQSSCNGSYMDPYFYRVKGIRVPYAKIGL
ncbi:MAG: hypothetical protein EOP54_19230 [Sphingobacteriales bacterium]|nr:MAG: hypothetical protein EOP54_19230 [Sphingobacteriales bacterium]